MYNAEDEGCCRFVETLVDSHGVGIILVPRPNPTQPVPTTNPNPDPLDISPRDRPRSCGQTGASRERISGGYAFIGPKHVGRKNNRSADTYTLSTSTVAFGNLANTCIIIENDTQQTAYPKFNYGTRCTPRRTENDVQACTCTCAIHTS